VFAGAVEADRVPADERGVDLNQELNQEICLVEAESVGLGGTFVARNPS
jgi:hypothetical protein